MYIECLSEESHKFRYHRGTEWRVRRRERRGRKTEAAGGGQKGKNWPLCALRAPSPELPRPLREGRGQGLSRNRRAGHAGLSWSQPPSVELKGVSCAGERTADLFCSRIVGFPKCKPSQGSLKSESTARTCGLKSCCAGPPGESRHPSGLCASCTPPSEAPNPPLYLFLK